MRLLIVSFKIKNKRKQKIGQASFIGGFAKAV